MTRTYNSLGRRILRLLTEEYGGERKRSVLAGIAGGEKKLKPVLGRLLRNGQVVMRRCYGGQRYGLPRKRAARTRMHSKRQPEA